VVGRFVTLVMVRALARGIARILAGSAHTDDESWGDSWALPIR
jgi:hypothetical protein